MSSAHPNTAGAAGTPQKKPGLGSMGRQGRNVGAAKRYDSNRGKLRLSKQNRVTWLQCCPWLSLCRCTSL